MTALKLVPLTPEPVAVRLRREMAELAEAERRVAELRAKVQAGCRRYSDENGYRVVLSAEQVRRSIAAESAP